MKKKDGQETPYGTLWEERHEGVPPYLSTYSSRCTSCGLSTMYDWWPESEIDPRWSLCPECDTCGECGCDCDTKGDQDENS